MKKTINLSIEIEYTGNPVKAADHLKKHISHGNCMCSSTIEGESFIYKVKHAIQISDEDCFHLRCFLSNWLSSTGYMHGERDAEAQAVFNLWEKL